MRGSIYAFANSVRLQRRLQELGIRYTHVKELAPAQIVRGQQEQEDEKLHIAKRTRTMLSENFIRAYEDSCLTTFDSQQFLQKVGPDANVIGLFALNASRRHAIVLSLRKSSHRI